MRRKQLMVIGVAIAGVVLVAGAWIGRPGPIEREFRWRRGEVELVGNLYLPETGGARPLAVIVPGSGCMPLSHRFYKAHIEELTARGVAVFAYNKRGCGASTGRWADVGLDGLAEDIVAALPVLAASASVDSTRIGLWGLSQGGWVSLIAAGQSSLVSHVVLLSGPPMTPAEQGDEVVTLGMRARNVDEASIAEALTLNRQLTQVYRTDSGWDSATAALRVASTRPWFSASVIAVIPRTDPHWQWFRRILDYDPLPALRDLTIPILGVYGERDILVPGPRAKAIIDSVARTAKGPRESAVIPGATHELRPWGNSKWSPDYWALLEAWMRRHRLLL